MNYHTTRLSNGLRVIHEPSASEVTYCGYVICAGTRHEDAPDAGMAHFIEHMSFKGTKRRRACHISNGLERVGGDLNAFTNKQETVYHATVLRQDFRRAADFLTDIVFGSIYPQHEIDKEVEVICDEIDSYRDSPAELIFDEFEAMLYAGHPLGRDILGTPERLRQYTTADAVRFAQRHYRPENAVFFVYGDVDFNTVTHTLERQFTLVDGWPESHRSFSDETAGMPAQSTEQEEPLRIVEKDTHQAHVLIGGTTFGGADNRRFALMLLNNMLGGPGGNSRLNMSLREKAGLVYSRHRLLECLLWLRRSRHITLPAHCGAGTAAFHRHPPLSRPTGRGQETTLRTGRHLVRQPRRICTGHGQSFRPLQRSPQRTGTARQHPQHNGRRVTGNCR